MATLEKKVAIVESSRTPFVKAGTSLKEYSMQDLGKHVLKSVVEKSKIDPNQIDEFVFGSVLLDPRTPNWAREILFAAGLPKDIYAQSVSNNCISGLVAITNIAERIELGAIGVGIAGGSDSLSNPTLVFSEKASRVFLDLFGARTLMERLSFIAKMRLNFFAPQPPGVTEPSTGLTMGQHMELTAQEMNIQRLIQDEIAFASHQNAQAAFEKGILAEEISPLGKVEKDGLIRASTSMEKLATLRSVFDRTEKGTISAGNSSPLTDGASAVMLMSETAAKKNNLEPLAYVKHYEYSALDPNKGLLMAPAIAVPKLLHRLGYTFEDFDLIEVHEAFGAQVAANIQAWEEGWGEQKPIGKLDRTKLNVNGSSIAVGHPFAATGGRIVGSLAREMNRRFAKRGLISICAAGGMACAMILERE